MKFYYRVCKILGFDSLIPPEPEPVIYQFKPFYVGKSIAKFRLKDSIVDHYITIYGSVKPCNCCASGCGHWYTYPSWTIIADILKQDFLEDDLGTAYNKNMVEQITITHESYFVDEHNNQVEEPEYDVS